MDIKTSEHLFGEVLTSRLDAAYASDHLPQDFSDRLAAAIATRGRARARTRRWVALAALVALGAGVAFAASVAADAFSESDATPLGASAAAYEAGGATAAQGAPATPGTASLAGASDSGATTDGPAARRHPIQSGAAGGGGALSVASCVPVEPPYGAASSVATEYMELDARAMTWRETSAISLYTSPYGGVTILIF